MNSSRGTNTNYHKLMRSESGSFCNRMGVKRNRGQIAKVGSKRKGGENAKKGAVKMQRNYYSSDKLIEMAKHRGYFSLHAIAVGISQDTGLAVSTLQTKISSGHFSREEMIVIAAYFEMTPKEFCDVFLNGLFNENDLGHYIAHIDSAYAVLHQQDVGKKRKKRNSREEMLKDIVDQIDRL